MTLRGKKSQALARMLGPLFFVPTLLFFMFFSACLLHCVSLSYFILAVPMCECLVEAMN